MEYETNNGLEWDVLKAVIYEKFGPPNVLEYREVEKPTVMEDDILVKIHASSMNAVDWHIRVPTPSMARLMGGSAKTLFIKPKYPILGADFAGKVESVGKNIEQFKIDKDKHPIYVFLPWREASTNFLYYHISFISILVLGAETIAFSSQTVLHIAHPKHCLSSMKKLFLPTLTAPNKHFVKHFTH